MKILIRLTIAVCLLYAFSLLSCSKASNAYSPDCPVDTFVNNHYLNDAKQLVYERIIGNKEVADADYPTFNQVELGNILSAITSVRALNTPATDSIFNYYKIHTLQLYNLNSISLRVKPDSAAIINLLHGKPTGNTQFDALLSTYGFSYNGPTTLPANSPYVTLTTNTVYNMGALVPTFEQFNFVVSASVIKNTITDGNDLTYDKNGTTRTLNFSYGYGNCQSGCGHRITWQFNIDPGCHAVFVSRTVK